MSQSFVAGDVTFNVEQQLFGRSTRGATTEEAVFVPFAQQQVPVALFSAEQQHPERRPAFAPDPQLPEAPIGSNGHTTEVSTYNAIAHQTRQRSPLVPLLATRAFMNRT